MSDKQPKIEFEPIGIVHSPFTEPSGMPVQPVGGQDIEATIEIDKRYEQALSDLDGFSHIVLLFYLHRSNEWTLKVTPFLDDRERGVFSTRAPKRPNPIGMSIVELVSVEGNILHIRGVDMLDGTPVLDIKPYIPDLNPQGPVRIGWLEDRGDHFKSRRSDDRMHR